MTARQRKELLSGESAIGRLKKRLEQVDESIERYRLILRNTGEFRDQVANEIRRLELKEKARSANHSFGTSKGGTL